MITSDVPPEVNEPENAPKLRIQSDGTAEKTRVWIGDIEITQAIYSISWTLNAKDEKTCTLEFAKPNIIGLDIEQALKDVNFVDFTTQHIWRQDSDG
jgi:hypothetical protein